MYLFNVLLKGLTLLEGRVLSFAWLIDGNFLIFSYLSNDFSFCLGGRFPRLRLGLRLGFGLGLGMIGGFLAPILPVEGFDISITSCWLTFCYINFMLMLYFLLCLGTGSFLSCNEVYLSEGFFKGFWGGIWETLTPISRILKFLISFSCVSMCLCSCSMPFIQGCSNISLKLILLLGSLVSI